MRKLTTKQRASVIRALVEGCSIRSTCRMAGVTKRAVMKLVVDLGQACHEYHDKHVRRLRRKRIEADEIWAYVAAIGGGHRNGREQTRPVPGKGMISKDPTTRIAATTGGGRDNDDRPVAKPVLRVGLPAPRRPAQNRILKPALKTWAV